MDDGAERPGLFAKGSVGRFLLLVTLGATALSAGLFGLITAIVMVGSAGFFASHSGDFSTAWDEGKGFGDGRTITECVREVERRAPAECSSFGMCGIAISTFTRACIRAANDDGYCAPVPDLSEIGASIEWKRSTCAAAPSRWCQALMGDVQSACQGRKDFAVDVSAGSGASP
jgi:hypothetical protein